jgi:hypothetical protein
VTKSSRRASGVAESSKAPATSARRSSSSPTGSARAGRRERYRPSLRQKPFHERHRGAILALALVCGLALVGGFIFLSAFQPAYACSTIWQPPSPDPDPDSIGSPQDDMGRGHVPVGTVVRYTYCAPASGDHYNVTGLAPIPPRFFGPDEQIAPQSWVHNLEHGGMVILYRCADGACPSEADLATLRALPSQFPNSPVCGFPPGQVGPVIARLDQMGAPFAALLWNRVLYQETLDTPQMIEMFETEAEQANPEPLCPSPSPSPTPTPSASPSAGPSASPSASPAASPSPSPSPSASPSPS